MSTPPHGWRHFERVAAVFVIAARRNGISPYAKWLERVHNEEERSRGNCVKRAGALQAAVARDFNGGIDIDRREIQRLPSAILINRRTLLSVARKGETRLSSFVPNQEASLWT